MRKILFISLFFVSVLFCRCTYSEDNLLTLDRDYNKEKAATADKTKDNDKVLEPQQAPAPEDDSDKDLERMKAYRENLENKQKELDVIKLDLEKASLMLKKKEAEKEIYQIDKVIPGNTKESGAIGGLSSQDVKDPVLDSSDMKIQLLVISDNLKEGQISLKGASYSFKEGDVLPFKLTVEKIEPSGVTLKEPDGAVLKLNFVD